MKLEVAKKIARTFVSQIQNHCIRIKVAGSIRRGKYQPNDIEIVAIPDNFFSLKEIMDK